ncbi:MAG: inositol monophosphatase family protein, partial [Bacilli bacterium]
EWDVAAMDLLVKEAGGVFLDGLGKEFVYNRKDVYNRDGYSMFNSEKTKALFLG